MEMAKLAAERLDLGAQAVALYKRVLDEEPSSTAALDALEKQAERDKDFATVAEVLERRTALAPDAAARLAILLKLGGIYSDRVRDPAKAMSAWRRVLALQPGHAKALRVLRDSYVAIGDYDGLSELYAENDDWEGLVEVLSGAADKATDADLKVDLSFRCATRLHGAPERAGARVPRVRAGPLGPPRRRARRGGARAALREGREVGPPPGALRDPARRTGATPTRSWRCSTSSCRSRVSGCRIGRRRSAGPRRRTSSRRRARGPSRPSRRRRGPPSSGPASSTRSARGSRSSRGPAAAKKGKKKKDADGVVEGGRREELRVLRAKLAEVFAREMGRIDEAVQVYRQLVEEDETDDLAVQTLDRVLREADRRDDLRWLFNLRVERANTALKLDLLGEWALLEEEAFGSPENAVRLYRRMLELVPHHGGALRSLARLLRAQGDADGAAEVIALDRDQREGMERAAREIELAKLFVDPLHRYLDALGASERALELSPNDPRAVEVVEQLLVVGETRARAAAILERAYDQTGAAQRQAEVLEVLIATTAARDDRLALYGRLADVHAAKLGDAERRVRRHRARGGRVPVRPAALGSPRRAWRPTRAGRRISRRPSWRRFPSRGRRGCRSASSSISRSAPRLCSTRSSGTSIARRRISSGCSRGSRATRRPSTASSRS